VEDHAEFGAKVAHFPHTPVMLAAPLAEDSWLASRLRKFGDIPAAFLLKTADLQQAAKRFQLTGEAKWFGVPWRGSMRASWAGAGWCHAALGHFHFVPGSRCTSEYADASN